MNNIRNILPLDHTLDDIADSICKNTCYKCKKKLEGTPFRNSIAEYEYRKTGECQECQDKRIINPGINTRYVNDSLTGERILIDLTKGEGERLMSRRVNE